MLFGVTQTPDGPFIRPHPGINQSVLEHLKITSLNCKQLETITKKLKYEVFYLQFQSSVEIGFMFKRLVRNYSDLFPFSGKV